jgi:hypothetical protein
VSRENEAKVGSRPTKVASVTDLRACEPEGVLPARKLLTRYWIWISILAPFELAIPSFALNLNESAPVLPGSGV